METQHSVGTAQSQASLKASIVEGPKVNGAVSTRTSPHALLHASDSGNLWRRSRHSQHEAAVRRCDLAAELSTGCDKFEGSEGEGQVAGHVDWIVGATA